LTLTARFNFLDRPQTSVSVSVVAMNALIAACGRGRRPDLALAVFNEMKSKFGVRHDGRSYRSAAIACNQAEHESRFRRSSTSLVDENDFEDDDSLIQWWECALALLRRM
jgi:pentatricopeptide repeat protein